MLRLPNRTCDVIVVVIVVASPQCQQTRGEYNSIESEQG